MSYYFPGNQADFYREFGGLPQRGIGIGNIFAIGLVIIFIIIIVLALALLLRRQTTVYVDHEGFLNLELMKDLNTDDTECCVFAGDVLGNEIYLYDTTTGVTYSRSPPADINTTCNTFPDPAACVATNTDAEDNIIPTATFKAQPYYLFENGLFISCVSTATCP